MTIATVEMSADEVEQLRADLTSVRAEVTRLRGERAERLAQHPDRSIDDKFERVIAERDDLAGALAETERERDKAEAERDHLREQNGHLRDVNVRLGRAEADNAQTQRAVTTLAGERDTARAELREMGNALAEERAAHQATAAQLTKIQGHLDDAEGALVVANAARRLSNAEHLHQRLSAASLVIGRLRDWRYCPLCRDMREPIGLRHTCGRLIPVDIIIARRPREQP